MWKLVGGLIFLLMVATIICDPNRENMENSSPGVPTFKYTWPIYRDWDAYDSPAIINPITRNNNYLPPKGLTFGNRLLELPLDPDTNFYPYNWYQANDPFDYAPIDAWKNMPNRTWGGGIYDKNGYYLPVNM